MAATLHVFKGGKKDTPPQPPTSEIDIIVGKLRRLWVLNPEDARNLEFLADHLLKTYQSGQTPAGGW